MLYDATPDYAHSREVRDPRRLLFVSGTMGLNADGNAPPTLHEQLDLVGTSCARSWRGRHDRRERRRLTSYLRDAAYAEANAEARVAALDGRAVPTTAIVAETLTPEWLVEIELIAAG